MARRDTTSSANRKAAAETRASSAGPIPIVRQPTEDALQRWRNGQVAAERLCSQVLLLDGYESVDPQAPLGGPDALKDILCKKAGITFVAACYFPPTLPSDAEIEAKFKHDLGGAPKNKADGFMFFVNQHVKLSLRKRMIGASKKRKKHCELFHLERLRARLDSPPGYGVRLEYLRIPMTDAEQFDFWSQWKDGVTDTLRAQQRDFIALKRTLESSSTEFRKLIGPLLKRGHDSRRSEADIVEATEEFFDKVWYDRHQMLRQVVAEGKEPEWPKDILAGALKSAKRVEAQYGKKNLGPWTDIEWGQLLGKLSALRWALGDEWDMLDT